MTRTRTVRRQTVLAAAVGMAAPAIVHAQAYPARGVRGGAAEARRRRRWDGVRRRSCPRGPTRRAACALSTPSPGGTADVVCRILCAALTEKVGQTFTVHNKPG